MSEKKNIFDPEVVLPKLENLKGKIVALAAARKKLIAGILLITVAFFVLNNTFLRKNQNGGNSAAKTVSSAIGKSFDFPALNNQGKATGNKIKLTIASVEKTSQVLVNDKIYTAKNNKLFLIVNLEFKNDIAQPLNILPGDLIRLSYNNDEGNKFAPDLHNNMVPVAALSTKLDRVGFVVPDTAKEFKINVGELEGKKEVIQIAFPS